MTGVCLYRIQNEIWFGVPWESGVSEFYDTGVEQKNKVIIYVQVFYEILSKHDHKHFWWPFLVQLVAKPPKKHGFSISIMVFTHALMAI